MGHSINAKEEIYHALAERLSKTPEGAKINEEFMAILHRLYSESEAMVGSKFPLVPMNLSKIATITGIEEQELKIILDEMSNKGSVYFIPSVESESCVGCGICSDRCQIHAITMTDQGNGIEVPVVNNEVCIGCGVCSAACQNDSLTMSRRSVLHVSPENMKEKLTRKAQERGRL